MDWYALFVETGREELVQHMLQRTLDVAFQSLVPARRLPERRQGAVQYVVRPLFPGYVLLRTKMDLCIYNKITRMNRVHRVLRNESCGELWSKIPAAEMEPILNLLGDGEVIELSQVLLRENRAVVVSGPLVHKEPIIRKLDKRKGRAKIQLQFMGQERSIDVGIDLLQVQPPVSGRLESH